ncbi:hypothetical protein FACS189418_2720 [Clostridia bacterium]|nr:hypothetical protein FACS189418_2720 [Clostridia bacterium]
MKEAKRNIGLVCLVSLVLLTGCESSKKMEIRKQGITYLENKEYAKAIEYFSQALEESPNVVGRFEIDVLKYKAEAEFKMQDYASAAETYHILCQVDPKQKNFQYCREFALGREEEKQKRYEQALSYYESALEVKPEDSAVYNRMGLCKLKMEAYADSLALFQKGIALKQEAILPELYYNEAICYEYLGEFATALDKFILYQETYGTDEDLEREMTFLRSRLEGDS